MDDMKSRGIVLIVPACRRRPRVDEKSKVVKLKKNQTFESQEKLQKAWKRIIENAMATGKAPVCGDDGLYSTRVQDEITQIADKSRTFLINSGLGLLRADQSAVLVSDLKFGRQLVNHVDDGYVDCREWWQFLTREVTTSVATTAAESIKRGEKVLIALNATRAWYMRTDLEDLLNLPQDLLHGYVRIFGDCGETIPVELFPCLMPKNASALNRLIPGTRFNLAIRYAAAYQHCIPGPEAASSPFEDFERMQEWFTSGDKVEDMDFASHVKKHANYKISDLAAVMKRYGPENHYIFQRIRRQMRADGWRAPVPKLKQAYQVAFPEYTSKAS